MINVISAEESTASGVSWGAVMGGAFAAASLSLVLLALGAGLGLSTVSPWSNLGASAVTVGVSSILWLIAMQILSSALGGYLAGRLRTKWTRVHTDEVYFRDTAHGFLVWAVGSVIAATFLASSAVSMVGSATNQAASSPTEAQADPQAYFVDTLFRSDRPGEYDVAGHREAGQVLVKALGRKELSTPDQAYLSQMVVRRTGISQPEADKRVANVLNDARQDIDTARKAAAHTLLWLFIALLIGAFSSSLAATIGGRQRDNVQTV